MAPLRGWGPKGKRLYGAAPQGRWRTMRVIEQDVTTKPDLLPALGEEAA